ncbi:SAM-dependent methyltransferase [Bacillus benzoevorans]|uniref:SAM-dependent methyltransferase n=1 Tax=Bacillus benzoevorans TaxID=1456 RepID=A0A7X0HVQ0_9BACI|nr:SAM-dependent methyltransferase [Bacillus benzoevorans]MBB6447728.1 SAM-dependent methyltransferase [Bacillus benzoevorans]
MKDKEQYYDQLLNIHTAGVQKIFNSSSHYHRYEPTPYSALELLFNEYPLKEGDSVIDFGCGKGRLNFLIHHMFNASVAGIEMNKTFYQEAMDNLSSYYKINKIPLEKIRFIRCLAEEYPISSADNVFYFFNPFSVQIFMKVINHILLSVEETPRGITLILYFASDDYIFYLENDTAFQLKQEVRLPDLYESVPYERFLIYTLND